MFGGSIWHFVGGWRNAPKGLGFSEALSRVQVRVPVTAGAFAVWGTLFSCVDCTLTSIRQKEDPWNAIASGAVTGGILAARAGLKSMATNAVLGNHIFIHRDVLSTCKHTSGGVILAAMEGVGIAFQRVVVPFAEKRFSNAPNSIQIDNLDPPVDPMKPRSYRLESSSYVGQPLLPSSTINNQFDSIPEEKSTGWRLW